MAVSSAIKKRRPLRGVGLVMLSLGGYTDYASYITLYPGTHCLLQLNLRPACQGG